MNSQTPISSDLVSSGAVDELRAAATKVADSAKLLQKHAVDAARDKVREVRSYAESNPLAAAGIAFAAGVLLTALIRR